MDLGSQMEASEQATQSELSRLQVHARALSSAAPASSVDQPGASSPKAQAPALQPEGWRSAAQLAAWLGHPWASELDRADATAHQRGISLTRFQVDLGAWGTRAGQPLAWRLQAAVPDDATALQWVQALGPQAELQRRDALPQPVPSERGTLSWRVDVSSVVDDVAIVTGRGGRSAPVGAAAPLVAPAGLAWPDRCLAAVGLRLVHAVGAAPSPRGPGPGRIRCAAAATRADRTGHTWQRDLDRGRSLERAFAGLDQP
ncbi:hypothetical protein DAPPUDRAFT_121803, partial [Daphnia pulex]